MHSKFSKIKVEDLLNDAPARGKTSHRPTPVESDIFKITCRVESCGKRFASIDALHAHQRRSHAAPTPFVCRQCTSTFSSSANLNKHIRSVHDKIKPFKCNKCSAAFGFKDGLQRHIRMVHEQARPYICHHCSLKFKTKAHLTNHSHALHPEAYSSSHSQRSSASFK